MTAQYTLISVLRHTPRLFQRRLVSLPKEALASPRHAEMSSSIIAFSDNVLSIVIFGGTWLVPGFGWNITSVFFRLIVSPNRRAALARVGDSHCR